MSYADEANAIRSRFNTMWVDGGSARTPIAWPNVTFTKPNEGPWVRLEIAPSGADLTTMGGRIWFDGTVEVQVFVPVNEGDGEAQTLAQHVVDIFENEEADGVIYDTPFVTTAGATDDGWYQKNVWCPYRRKSA